MTLTERQRTVLQQFNIVNAKGDLVYLKLIRPEDKPLGYGPKVHPDVLKKLIALDTTEGQIWLEWIFHQAAGGDRARESSLRAMEQMKQRFLDERLHGYQHAKTREVFPPVNKTEAERRWAAVEQRFAEVLVSADQDAVEKLGVWGFFREWPGNQGIYQKVSEVFTVWMDLQPNLALMNQERARNSEAIMASKPSEITDIEQMESLCKKIVRYFASLEARKDVRLASYNGNDWIYNDDTLIVLCPLTYATSVRYGCDGWSFANRDAFERLLMDENNFNDNWGSATKKGAFYAFVRFKCPVPRWVGRKNNQFQVYELTNLAVELGKQKAGCKGWSFVDEEGQSKSYEAVKALLRQEVTRPEDAADQEMPVKRGPNVYTTAEEAERIVAAFSKAMQAVEVWANTFDVKRVKCDPMDYQTKLSAGPPAE